MTEEEQDGRPAIAIGHVSLRVADVARTAEFFVKLGLRPVVERDAMAILELRGGTHLLLFRAKGRPRSGPIRGFDFMVDDLIASRDDAAAQGLDPGPLKNDTLGGHRYFEVRDPDGHVVTVFSSHTEGRAV